jgi:DNA-directed RNA polymerase specialized sigma24 family protein
MEIMRVRETCVVEQADGQKRTHFTKVVNTSFLPIELIWLDADQDNEIQRLLEHLPSKQRAC